MKKMLVTGLALLSASVMADGLPFVREIVASNPGMEVIVPYRSLDSTQTKLTLRFDVYPLGSNVKLFSSTAKVFTVPTLSCSMPVYIGKDEYFTAGAITGGSMEIMGVTFDQDCWANGKDIHTTFIYGVNLSAAGKTPWVKTIANSELWLLEPVKADGDSADELMLGIDIVGHSGATTMLLDPITGAQDIPAADHQWSNTYFDDLW